MLASLRPPSHDDIPPSVFAAGSKNCQPSTVNLQATSISRDNPRYPARLHAHLDAPSELTTLGNLELLALPSAALFCSARCPGKFILAAYDQAAKWRDTGVCVVSGFHSPVEKECLRILLRGSQPVIICPARSLPQRLPPKWKKLLSDGRLLILSAFAATENRVTAELAVRRNEFVATLATEITLIYAAPGGRLEGLIERLEQQGRSVRRLAEH
jgi:predicted Rossmann fold nucleotide-binding protein DprA/Smf involved in DNA uptake